MGNLVSQPIYGNDCGFLTPGIFPAGENPKNMLCTFFDVELCPLKAGEPPVNGSAIITQNANCDWEGLIGDKDVLWQAKVAATDLKLTKPGEGYFSDVPNVVGEDEFTNDYLNCVEPTTFAKNGTAQVSLEPYETNSYELTETLKFVPPEETYYTDYMVDSASPFTSVTRLSSHRWNTNILIKRER